MSGIQGKRLLITGVTGFIGANLARELLRRGGEVHALVRPGSRLWRVKDIVPQITVHQADVTNLSELERAVNEVRPQMIFHLARSIQDYSDMLRTNIMGTANLLQATAPLGYERLIHLGSSTEYGMKNKPIKESDTIEPVTNYAASKAAATILCQQFARASNKPVVILRPFSVYGYWEDPTRLIPTTILAAMRRGEISLTAPGYRRDWVFIEDLLEACILAMQNEKVVGETINIGSGKQSTNEDVVDKVQTLFGQKIRVHVGAYTPRPVDTDFWVADVRKAKRLLRWEPRHTLEEGLTKTISWFHVHQNYY